MRKETDKLKKVADEGAKRVKELGNVQNWAEMLERDFLVLGETMKLVRQGDRESGWRGGEEGWETSSGSESFSGSEDEGEEGGKGMDEGNGDETVKPVVEQRKAANGEGDNMVVDREDTSIPTQEKAVDGVADKMEVGKEELDAPGGEETQRTLDDEGDTAMDEVEEDKVEDKAKGKEVAVESPAEVFEGSSTTVTTGSGSTSTSDPSSSSIHTAASGTS